MDENNELKGYNALRASLAFKKRQGIELNLEEKYLVLEMDVKRLQDTINYLVKSLEKLEESQVKNEQTPVVTNDITISMVKYLYFIKEYEYKGRTYDQFLVTLEDDSKYYVDKIKGSQPKIEEGDAISYKIDGDKLREVRVLYNV